MRIGKIKFINKIVKQSKILKRIIQKAIEFRWVYQMQILIFIDQIMLIIKLTENDNLS